MSALKTQLDHILQYWDARESELQTMNSDHKNKYNVNEECSPIAAQPFTPEGQNALEHSPEQYNNEKNKLTNHYYRKDGSSECGKEKVWLKESLHRLELARAALSVYTSNTSSELRPTLQTLFKFIFDLADSLLADKMSNIVRMQNSNSNSNKIFNLEEEEEEYKDTQSFLTECQMPPSHVNAVAVAYAKVRATEVKMNDLVEASSAQRDKFAAQLELSEMKQRELTELLMHQIELTDGLLRNGSVIIGNACNTDLSNISTFTKTKTTTNVNTISNNIGDVNHNNIVVPLSINDAGVIRDGSYVNRLITRARREKEFESMECKVIALTEENKNLQNKVSELLRLNGRYARQSIELSARISLIHQHNIQLATDAQLHQKNLLVAEQRVSQLQSQILKLRHLLLMWMATASVPLMDDSISIDLWNNKKGTNNTTTTNINDTITLETVHKQLRKVLAIHDNNSSSYSSSCDNHDKANAKTSTRNNVCDDEIEYDTWHKEQVVHQLSKKLFEEDERHQQSILETNESAINNNSTNNVTKMKNSHMFHIVPCGYDYILSYSLNKNTPLHLRTNQSMMRLFRSFHPLLAEAIIQELLRQRAEFNTYYEREVVLRDAIDCFVPYDKIHARAINMNVAKLKMEENVTNSTVPHNGNVVNDKNSMNKNNNITETEFAIPFDAFVTLFINVMWLNRRKNNIDIFASNETKESNDKNDTVKTATPNNNNISVTTENTESADNSVKHINKVNGEVNDPEQELRDEMILIHTGSSNDCSGSGSANTTSWKSKIINDQLLQLPLAGQRLAYSLDTLSRSPCCGFLTYAFGYVSRREVSELIFDVLREERRVLLRCCQLIEQNWNATLVQLTRDNTGVEEKENRCNMSSSNNNSNSVNDKVASKAKSEDTTEDIGAEKDYECEKLEKETANECTDNTINGYIPSIQFAKLLAAMYPCYSVEMLTDLMYAAMLQTSAFAGNTSRNYYNTFTTSENEYGYSNSSAPQENNTSSNTHGNAKAIKAKHKTELMVYYSTLLPERLLCDRENVHELVNIDTDTTISSVERKNRVREDYSTKAAIAHAEWASPNTFSKLFYKFIIDDALHGIQRVQECVEKYEQEEQHERQERQQEGEEEDANKKRENVQEANNEINSNVNESCSNTEKCQVNYAVMQVKQHKSKTSMSVDEINRFIFSHLSVQEQDYWNMSLHAALKRYAKAVLSKDDYHINNYMQVSNIVPVIRAHIIIRIAPNRDFHSVYSYNNVNKEMTWNAEQLRFISMFSNHWVDVIQNINKLCEKKNICVAITATKETNDASIVNENNEVSFDTIYITCKEFDNMLHQVDPHRLKLWGTSLVAKGNHLLRAANSATMATAPETIATKLPHEKERAVALTNKSAMTKLSTQIVHDKTEKKSMHIKHKRKNNAKLVTTNNPTSNNNSNNS